MSLNYLSYVKKFGHLTFEEKPFNHVDAAILANVVYTNLEVVAPSIFDTKTKATLFKKISAIDVDIVGAGKTFLTQNKKMIKLLKASKRFGDVGIRYIDKVFEEELANQFFAATFIIPNTGAFVALRGTDVSIAGWVENFRLAVNKVVLSQLDAKDYLQIVASLVEGPIMVGGTSKGGNLALYAAIHCDKQTQDRITAVYDIDGNGLNDKEIFEKEEYLRIKDRIVFLKPYDAIVSELMYAPKDYKIIKSGGFSLMQHNTYCWKINKDTGDFIYLKNKSKSSYITHMALERWINSLSVEDKELLANFMCEVFGGMYTTLFTFIVSCKIRMINKAKKKLSEDERVRLKQTSKALFKAIKDSKRQYKEEHKKK